LILRKTILLVFDEELTKAEDSDSLIR
jgi:hypothetical protein